MFSGKNPQRRRDELQKLSELLDEKIIRLRTAKVTETNPAVIFQLDKQIEEAELEHNQVVKQIEALNQSPESRQQSQNFRPVPRSKKYSSLLKIGGLTVISFTLTTLVYYHQFFKPIPTPRGAPSSSSPMSSSQSEMTFTNWCLKKDLTIDEKHTVNLLLSEAKKIVKKSNLECQSAKEALAQIPNGELDLRSKQIVDIKPLSSLNNLKNLDLQDNLIKDITPLSSLTNLQVLSLNQNSIKNLEPLSPLRKLVYLNLSDNQIEDITPLKSLINLKDLYLQGNQIQEVTSLASLTDLTTLKLNDNNIRNVKALSSLTNLKEPLELYSNPISNRTCPVQAGCKFFP